MKTLMTIVISVGASVIFMYYLMRQHNKLHHSSKCKCKKLNGAAIVITQPSTTVEPVSNDTPIDEDVVVGDILDAARG